MQPGPQIRAISVRPASTWSGEVADSVVLDYDDRHRRRLAMTGTKGTGFLLDLPAAAALRGGDALVLEDGRLIEVLALPEPLLEIRCNNPQHLARLAWHLGNRHLPAQFLPKTVRIRHDHVIAEMATQFGAQVNAVEAPFDPEGGAYDHTGAHDGHDHGR